MNPNVFETGNTQIQARLLSLSYDKTSLEKTPWEYRRNRLYRKQYKNQNDLYYNKPIYRQETIFQTSIGFDKIKDPETLVLAYIAIGLVMVQQFTLLGLFYYMCMQLHVDSKLSHWKCT